MKNNPITIFGEVLFDNFPDGGSVLGGAPFNVAWHLQALGQSPQFLSRVGADPLGERVRIAMDNWGMNLDFLQEDSAFPTGQVQVSINHGEPSYSILANQAYDHIEIRGFDNAHLSGFLYHGTLAVRSITSWDTLLSLKKLHQGSKIFMDVNLRQPWWNKADVLQLVDDADWVKLNVHELNDLQGNSIELRPSMEKFLSRHNLEGIILTCGEKGALALKDSGEFFSVSPSIAIDIVDTVGAGDAFSAIFLLGLNLGWSLAENMERAQLFASAMTRQQGATVNDLNFYQPFIKSWGL